MILVCCLALISTLMTLAESDTNAGIDRPLDSSQPKLNHHDDPLKWQKWSAQLFDTARKENKLVLLDLVADWCQFCAKMDNTTYQDEEVISVLKKHYIIAKVDEADHPVLAEQYKNDGRPTTVIFDHQGNQIVKRVGYIKPQWMGWMLQAVAQNPVAEAHE